MSCIFAIFWDDWHSILVSLDVRSALKLLELTNLILLLGRQRRVYISNQPTQDRYVVLQRSSAKMLLIKAVEMTSWRGYPWQGG